LKKLVPVVLLCTLALLSITVVKSLDPPTATVASVWTTDTGNVGKLNFDSGEPVRIHWQADGTVDIELKYIDGTLDKKWTNQPSSGHVDCIPQLGMGKYKIYVTGADTLEIAYGTFFVIPELAFGTFTATVAGLGSFGLARLKRRKRHEI